MSRRQTAGWLAAGHFFAALVFAQQPVVPGPADTKSESHSPAAQPLGVPGAAPAAAVPHEFHDTRYGVSFEVPAGWNLATSDNQLSTYHLDARTAGDRSEVRAVAAIDFNPFPLSTFSGATFYYSVERRLSEHECALEAYSFGTGARSPEAIGGMEFLHGHDDHGGLCTEARDEVYTAYRKGSCYRFDLTVNTFCSVSSGALEMTKPQLEDVENKMDKILNSVVFTFRPAQPGQKDTPYRRVIPLRPDEDHPAAKAAQAAL